MAGFPLAAGAFGATVAVSFTGATHFCFCAGFSDACMTSPSTCADGRRPRSAKARNRA